MSSEVNMSWTKWMSGVGLLTAGLLAFLLLSHNPNGFIGSSYLSQTTSDSGLWSSVISCSAHSLHVQQAIVITESDIRHQFLSPLIYPVPKSVFMRKSRAFSEHDDTTGTLPLSSRAVLTPAEGVVHFSFHIHKGVVKGGVPSDDEWKYACQNLIFDGSVKFQDDTPSPILQRVSTVDVHVLEPNAESKLAEYWLSIERAGRGKDAVVNVFTYSHAGLLAAVATLNQLLVDHSTINNNGSVNSISLPLLVHDWSDYEWRGLMVDVARHFIPLPLLIRTVDGMAAAKLNVLHLHLTDSQVRVSPLERVHVPLLFYFLFILFHSFLLSLMF